MRILTSSADLIAQILGNVPFEPMAGASCHAFDSYDFDDLDASGERHIFETQGESFGNWDNVILERNAASSQLVRLRQWCGSSVMTVALKGNGFIGKGTRKWKTLEGNLFWCCAIPVCLPLETAPRLQMLPVECLFETLAPYWKPNVRCAIKQPNDLVLMLPDPHKIAGCLTEIQADSQNIRMVRYGIGLNLVAAPVIDDPAHLPAACCMPYFKPQASVYGNILMALSRSIIEHARHQDTALSSD